MIELPADLPSDLVPLSWLLGVWEGTGVIDYEVEGHHFTGEFTHRVTFRHDSGDHLSYSASAVFVTGDDEATLALADEVGFWRVARERTDADAGPGLLPPRAAAAERGVDDVEALRNDTDGFDIEVSLVRSDGVSELYLGTVTGPRVDLATDAVVRTSTAREYVKAERMYGLVDGHLLWAWDISALGAPLASHASARLAKVD